MRINDLDVQGVGPVILTERADVIVDFAGVPAGTAFRLLNLAPDEIGSRKDTVIAYPGEITRVKATYDRAGLSVWHCHSEASSDVYTRSLRNVSRSLTRSAWRNCDGR